MIIDMVHGYIWDTSHKHIAFAVNTEKDKDTGFVRFASSHYWESLAKIGEKKLGETMSYKAGDKILHALVCYSFHDNGWDKTPKAITQCLDSLDVPESEPIAVFLMGISKTSRRRGANVFTILGGIARSRKSVVAYFLS